MTPRPAARFGLKLCLAVAILCDLAAGQYTLSLTSDAGFMGETATSQAQLDSSGGDELKGWSFGVCSDQDVLEVASATSGATTQTVQSGDPPDFESIDIFPDGVTHGVVICFMVCATLPPGSGYELLDIAYNLIGEPGTSTVCFCGTLGSPAVPTIVVDSMSAAVVPTQLSGGIEILPPILPVIDLDCSQTGDLCTCSFLLTWTNDGTYDAINIYEDAVLIATLGGAETSFLAEDVPGTAEYCVEPTRAGGVGPQVCCMADCAVSDVFPDPVEDLVCLVDDPTCTATLTWVNTSIYEFLRVTIDGVEAAVLTGDEQMAVVVLPGAGTYDLCVDGETVCEDPVPATCCTLDCLLEFSRGDANGDGAVDIADPIAFLNFFFADGEIPDCDDAADSNDDGLLDIADGVYTLNYLFTEGPEPPAPFLVCAFDPTVDSLRCLEFDSCP